MQTKLTLRLEEELIGVAKEFARSRGKSVSRIVADYFALLGRGRDEPDISPTVRTMRGSLRGVNAEDYRRYLEDKYL
ncbi:MAG: DUF6364 family protein [Gemmatimonadota bacterium]|nr:DUF6364 family protein [Gemmatimonadota bacterium]